MKKIIVLLLILSLTLTTGCWDMIEIENRIFPYTVTFELNHGEDSEENKYKISFTYPNINALGKNPTQEETVYIASTTANNVFEAVHNLSTNIHSPIYLKQLRVVILEDEIARDEKLIREISDGLNRGFLINKMVNIVVAEEEVNNILNVKLNSKKQETVEGLIYSLLRNRQNSTRFTTKTLKGFIEDMDMKSGSIVPLIKTEGDEIALSGGVVFKDYRLIGYINEEENKDIVRLKGKVKEDSLNVDYNGIELSVSITKNKCKKKLIKDQDNLKVLLNIDLEGELEEYIILQEDGKITENVLKAMEKDIEEKTQKQLNTTIQKIQKQLGADILGINEYLYKYHPKVWENVKENWEDVFFNMDIDLKVNMDIRTRGLTK